MMRKAYHLKLLTAILIMFIVSLPEFFKTHEASTITMSCIDARSLKNITFPLCAFNNPCKSHLQQGKKNQTVFLKVFVNHSCLHDPLCVCQVGYSALQPCIVTSSCESDGDQNIIHQGPRSEAQVVKGSLEAKEEDFISVYKHFIYTVDHVNEEREEYQTAYVLEVHIRNSTGRGESAGEETMNHSCIAVMMEDHQNDCINISLQLESHAENPICPVKIMWLVLVPSVFLLTVTTVTYKIFQENKKQTKNKNSLTAPVQKEDDEATSESTPASNIQVLSDRDPFLMGKANPRTPSPFTQKPERLPPIPEHEPSACCESAAADILV